VPVQALKVNGAPAWGIQFHFEVDRPEMELWADSAGPDLETAWGKSGATMLAEADEHLARQEGFAGAVFRSFAAVMRERS
jgi:hypothetical protein